MCFIPVHSLEREEMSSKRSDEDSRIAATCLGFNFVCTTKSSQRILDKLVLKYRKIPCCLYILQMQGWICVEKATTWLVFVVAISTQKLFFYNPVI